MTGSAGKVALITGAGAGIGRAVADVFLQEGYRVGLLGLAFSACLNAPVEGTRFGVFRM